MAPSVYILSILLWTLTSGQQTFKVPIGVLVGGGDNSAEQALIHVLNEAGGQESVTFQLHVESVDLRDTYIITQAVKQLLEKYSIVTLVVPSLTPEVSWLANHFSLPVVSLKPSSLSAGTPEAAIEVSPDPLLATIEVMRYYKWSALNYFYQGDEGVHRFQTLQQTGSGALNFSSWHLNRVEDSHTARTLLRKLDVANPAGRVFVLLDLEPDLVAQVLMEVSRATYLEKKNFHFLLAQPADESLWREPFHVNEVHLTGIRLYDPKALPETMTADTQRNQYGATTQWLLGRDAGRVLVEAFIRLGKNEVQMLQEILQPGAQGPTVQNGAIITRYLRETQVQAGTSGGALQFDSVGKRRGFVLDIFEPSADEPVKAFSWSDATGLNVVSPSYVQRKTVIGNRTLIVTTILNEPFMMKNDESAQGNDQFKGFSKDLLDLLSNLLNFKYELKLVKDLKYGSMASGEWNGMIGEVVNHEADMAIADLTITSHRQTAVDMSIPYLTVGISIMVKRPTGSTGTTAAYFFLSPFASEVWGCLFVAMVLVGLAHFAVGRLLTKADPHQSTGCSSLLDSLWFAFGSLFIRQTGLQPKSFTNRVLSGVWWVFAFFILSLYITSLVSLLVSSEVGIRGQSREEDMMRKSAVAIIEESVNSGQPKIGLIKGGSTEAFFRHSPDTLYSRFWETLKADPSVFAKNSAEGVARVKESDGDYAFLMESSTNEYISMRDCQTLMIPQLLDSKGYGVVTAKGSIYSPIISTGLLQLRETGVLQKLYNKWWLSSSTCSRLQGDKKMMDMYHSSMTLSDVAGVFYLLIAGALLTLLVGLGEILYSRKIGRSSHRVALTNMSSKSESDQLNGENFHGTDPSSI